MGQLAGRLERQTDRLARAIVEALVEAIPAYGGLPREQLESEIVPIARANIAMFVDHLRSGESDFGDLDEVRASAVRRAEERVPLEALLHAYGLGTSIVWEALRQEVRPDEADEVLGAATLAFSYLREVSAAVAAAYLEEREAISGEERDARRSLLDALLAGRPTQDLATRAGVRLAPSHIVLALSVGSSPDEQRPGISRAVAARRKQRRLEEHLAAIGPGVHTLLGAGGGTVLVPADDPGGVDVAALVGRLGEAAPAEVWGGVAWAPNHEAVPAAVAEAGQVLRLVRSGIRPPGAYRLSDVLLEHLVSQPGAAEPLRALLAPLEQGSDLLQTLEGWFAADFDRRAAATALAIHPNTLDYRLRRIGELTGLDLRRADTIQLLGAALLTVSVDARDLHPD